MELIPVINLEALNNPSFLSRVISGFELGKIYHAHRLWKWGAFLLALVYAFNCVANKLRLLLRHYHFKSKSFLANTAEPLLCTFDDELYSSDDDEDDVVSVSSNDGGDSEDEDDEDDEKMEMKRWLSYEDLSEFEDDFTVNGQKRKFKVTRRKKSLGDDFSLSDLVNETGIVKLWDGFGVEKSFPFLDLNKDVPGFGFGSFFGSPLVVTSRETGGLGLNVWDFRCSKSEPAVRACWPSNRTGLAVGDVRMIDRPLTEGATKEEEMWWDAVGISG